jgi:hypothetical protein
MNERFLEIAKHAGLKFPSETALSPMEEKFAELIVRDCAKVCDEIAEMAEITNSGEVARKTRATAVSCSNFIKNRFGVK